MVLRPWRRRARWRARSGTLCCWASLPVETLGGAPIVLVTRNTTIPAVEAETFPRPQPRGLRGSLS
eukprot:3426348-Lingulodinium_polyedra.AAC.1